MPFEYALIAYVVDMIAFDIIRIVLYAVEVVHGKPVVGVRDTVFLIARAVLIVDIVLFVVLRVVDHDEVVVGMVLLDALVVVVVDERIVIVDQEQVYDEKNFDEGPYDVPQARSIQEEASAARSVAAIRTTMLGPSLVVLVVSIVENHL